MSTPELSTIEAFEEALRADAAGDEDRNWELISHLYIHGGREALEVAARWSGHPEPARRRLAANVLGMLGTAPDRRTAGDGRLREDSLALLLTMLSVEPDLDVLYAITIGLKPTGDEPAPAPLIGLHTHPDAKVRRGVAFGLSGRPDMVALDTLITLSADEDAQVRASATFGLARLTDEDFPRLRDALAARLHDDNLDTRVEAGHGLATRGDQRAMQPLLDILESPLEPSRPELVAEALCALATTIVDPRLRPHLLAARDRRLDDPIDKWPYDLRTALAKYGEPLPPDTRIAMPMPELSTIEAFEEALRADAVDDEDRKSELISHLYDHGGQEALEVAARWSGDPEPARRKLAANVLRMLGAAPSMARADGPLRKSSLALLITMLSVETDSDVLFAITIALGPNGDEPVPAPLIGLHTHPDAMVRYGVATSLVGCPDMVALDTLITLSADESALVRQEATFGLARLNDEDFPRLRDALADRLHDYNLDTRVEAVHGLATRGDQRAMQPLLDILESPLKPADPELVTEALCALATTMVDPRLRPHLLAERDRRLDDPIDEWPDDLRTALAKYGEPLPR